MPTLCAACGNLKGSIALGGTLLCRQCEPAISAEIAILRAAGRAVNVAHIAHRIYKETNSGGNYLLRDIPQELWDKAKHRAVDDADSLRDIVLKALHAYLK
jgi:hypothetical protein